MKQVIILCAMIVGGTVAALLDPFFGILPYYALSVLRPQSLWEWALPDGVRWSLYAALGALFAVALSVPRVVARMEWNRVTTLMVIFGTLVLFSCVSAMNSHVAGQWAMEYLKIFVMAAVATAVIHTVPHLKWLAWMLVVTIGYLAWEFNSRYIFDGRLDIFTHGHDGWDNNGAGLLIAMGIPFAYWMGMAHRRWWMRASAGVVFLLMIHTVMLTYSRGAMVAAIVGLAWLGLNHRPRWQAGVLGAAVVTAVLFLAGPEIRREFLSITRYHEDPSAISRLESWSAAWQIAWDHPLLGVGVRNGNLYSQVYGADIQGRTIHSQYLQIAADNGIPAALVYILLCGTSWWCAFRSRRRLRAEAARIESETDDAEPLLRARRMREIAFLALSLEAALIVFFFGGLFLSLETFEIAWLLFVFTGAMPGIVERAFGLRVIGKRGVSIDPSALPPPLLARDPALLGRWT